MYYGSGERRDFNQFILDMELDDIPLVGRNFTWYRPNGKDKSRIDRSKDGGALS